MINTTINIHIETMDKINEISRVHNISKQNVIKKLLKKMMNKEFKDCYISKCVKYQDSDLKQNWYKFHISLDFDEYEYFIDLRKFFKMSVSAIVAFSVKKYFNEIIKSKIFDNYQFKHYVIIKETINNVITWRIFWGFPEKMGKILSAKLIL